MTAGKTDHDAIAVVMDLANHSLFPGDPLFLIDLARELQRGKIGAERYQAVDELLQMAGDRSHKTGSVDELSQGPGEVSPHPIVQYAA